jgi:hypothetical protein
VKVRLIYQQERALTIKGKNIPVIIPAQYVKGQAKQANGSSFQSSYYCWNR